MSEFLTRRAGFWHYQRRVPLAFVAHDPRGIVRQSTRIRIADDPRGTRAARAADRINGDLEAFWRASLIGGRVDAKARYDRARKDARRMGFEYMTAADVAQLPLAEILARLEALAGAKPDDKPTEVASYQPP